MAAKAVTSAAVELGCWSAALNTQAVRGFGDALASVSVPTSSDSSFLDLYMMVCSQIGVVPHPQILRVAREKKTDSDKSEMRPLTEIQVFGWSLDLGSATALSFVLPVCAQLTSLRLWNAGLTPEVVKLLANTLPSSSITHLNLAWNPFTESCGSVLADLVSPKSPLQSISLRGNRLSDDDIRPLIAALENGSVHSVNLGSNDLSDVTAKRFSTLLRHNRTIKSLSLAYNCISEHGLISLLDILKPFPLDAGETKEKTKFLPRGPKLENGMASCSGNNILKVLVISYAVIGDAAVEPAIETLEHNKSLARLTLTRNLFSYDSLQRLAGHPRIVVDEIPSSYNVPSSEPDDGK